MSRRPSKDGKFRYELVLDPQSDADLVQLLEGNKEQGTSYTITLKAWMRGQLLPLIQQSLANEPTPPTPRSQPEPEPTPATPAPASASAHPYKQTAAQPLDPADVAKLLNPNDIRHFK